MSSTEAQRRSNAPPAPAGEESAVDTNLESLLRSVDRTAQAAEDSLEEARAIAAEGLAEQVEAGRQAAAAPDLASQLDSLLENVDPAKTSTPSTPGGEAASAPPAAGNEALAGQLDALLDHPDEAGTPETPPAESPEASATDATTTPPSDETSDTSATTEDLNAALDTLDGGDSTSPKSEPEHMTEEATEAKRTDAPPKARTDAASTTTESAASGTSVPPNATASVPAEMKRVEADPGISPPGPAPMRRVAADDAAASHGEAKPSLARRVGGTLMWPVTKIHAGANAAEAVTLRILAPVGRPMASASRGVRMVVAGFALYSAALGAGAAYYAIFVLPTTFYETRAAAFSLKDGSLPEPTHAAEGSHGTAKSEAGHEKGEKKEADSHGGAKADAKSKSKTPAKKKPADKKAASKKGAEKKAEGGGH